MLCHMSQRRTVINPCILTCKLGHWDCYLQTSTFAGNCSIVCSTTLADNGPGRMGPIRPRAIQTTDIGKKPTQKG